MDFQSKKARVHGWAYSSGLEGKDPALSPLTVSIQSVDGRLLDLVKSINLDSAQAHDFPQQLADQLEQIGLHVREAHLSIAKHDSGSLDRAAQILSYSALKVGAAKILSQAIEIQNLARLGEFSIAEEILGDMEIELLTVRSELS